MPGLKRDNSGHTVQALKPRPGGSTLLAYTSTQGQSGTFRAPIVQNDAGSALQTVNNDSYGTTHVRLCSTTDCYVAIGPSASVTATTGFLLPALTPEYFPVDVGDSVAVIQVSAGGNLSIAECA